MPWLLTTALLHAIAASHSKPTMLIWVIFLSLSAFALTLLGTFLVRSGVLTSVHAFAHDPKRGIFILLLLAVFLLPAYGLLVLRSNWLVTLQRKKNNYLLTSRQSLLWLMNMLLTVSVAIILLGILYPLLLDALGLGLLSVGPTYFNQTVVPLFVLLLFVMSWAIYSRYNRRIIAWKEWLTCWLLAMIVSLLFIWVSFSQWSMLAVMVMSVAVCVLFTQIDFIVRQGRYWLL